MIQCLNHKQFYSPHSPSRLRSFSPHPSSPSATAAVVEVEEVWAVEVVAEWAAALTWAAVASAVA